MTIPNIPIANLTPSLKELPAFTGDGGCPWHILWDSIGPVTHRVHVRGVKVRRGDTLAYTFGRKTFSITQDSKHFNYVKSQRFGDLSFPVKLIVYDENQNRFYEHTFRAPSTVNLDY